MRDDNKIRILWIDDRERVSGFPQKKLPKEFVDYFCIAHPNNAEDYDMSYGTAETFMEVFKEFWFSKNFDYLPAEIIAMDYNLKKRPAADRSDEKYDPSSLIDDGSPGVSGKASTPDKNTSQEKKNVNYDGLLLGSFYAMLTYSHPAAVVSITNYMGKMPSEVKTLHEIATPFLGVNFEHNLPAMDRSWQNIILEGVKHLRERIRELYKDRRIVLPTRDLMALTESADHDALTIHSPFATRRLPLQGLFIDIPEPERAEAIRAWAK